jgi:hypothetical protein
MQARESRRARELREQLAERLGLSEPVVGKALLVFMSGINDRLPRGTTVALCSWVPETWKLISGHDDFSNKPHPLRGADAIRTALAAVGVPGESAFRFVTDLVQFLGQRCGTPISDTLRRKVPEIAEMERASTADSAPR